MALIECNECGNEVSNKAEQCPKCGAPIKPPKPLKKEKKPLGCGVWVVGLFIVAIFIGVAEEGSKSGGKSAAKQLSESKPKKSCGDDLDCLYREHKIDIAVQCSKAVERLALNSFKWTNAWHEDEFPYYRWKNKEQRTIVAMGDKIQYQNGFGAYINHRYYCRYDLNTKRAVKVEAEAGRF